MTEAEQALSRAKIELMDTPNSVFFCTLAFNLKHIFDEKIPTAATDGTYVRYNPDFFLKLSKKERVFLLLHETMHVAYMHMCRAEHKNKRLYNIAADYVINLQLVNAKFQMPKEGLLDKQYEGMSTEQVYELLQQQNTPVACDGIGEDLQTPTEPIEGLTEKINGILISASIQAKQANCASNIPADLDRFINSLVAPKLPWERVLSKYMNEIVKDDYSYRRPNKRYLPDLYLPSMNSDGLASIAIAIDASGSVTTEEFTVFISEINKIIKTLKPKNITLIQFDTDILSVNNIASVSDLAKIKFKGYGGTDVNPVISWINREKPAISLVFTDGEFYGSVNTTKQPLIWLIHNNLQFKAKYGKVIHYKI